MISIVYNTDTKLVKEYHDYPGRRRPFSNLNAGYAVWHVPGDMADSVSTLHDSIKIDGDIPVGTFHANKARERVRALAIQTGGMWKLPNTDVKQGQQAVLFSRFRGIGDVLMSWFGLEEYRVKYPDRHITYFTSPDCAALFCGQQGLVDKVLYSNFKHPATKEVPGLPISEREYSESFNLINGVDFGAIAYQHARADNFAALMEVEIRSKYDAERDLYIPEIPVRMLMAAPEEIAKAKAMIGYKVFDKVLVMQLNSNGMPRQWFYWNELARMCIKAGYKVVYVSTYPQHSSMKKPGKAINLTCKTTMREYIALLSLANILVCCDSSGLHIGARLPGLKVISLWGSTRAWAHAKYYQNVTAIEGQANCAPCWDWQLDSCDMEKERLICMRRITAEMVMERILE